MESIDAVREIIHPLVTELCLWLQTWSYEVLENLAPGFDHKPMIFGGSDWRPASLALACFLALLSVLASEKDRKRVQIQSASD